MNRTIAAGVALALTACIFWGWSYQIPALLSDYDPVLVASARYIGLGLLCIPIGLAQRRALARLTARDWLVATELSVIGNLGFYVFLALCVQMAGSPISGMETATIPVLCAICANLLDRRARAPWRRLVLPLTLLAAGIALARSSELAWAVNEAGRTQSEFTAGVLFGAVAVATWVYYPIRNSFYLARNPQVEPFSWATAQGLTLLPFVLVLYAGRLAMTGAPDGILGPRPMYFVTVSLLIAFFGSWLGFALWSVASKMLPAAIVGQMVVFEPLCAIFYAFLLRGQMPPPAMAFAVAAVALGTVLGVRAFQHRN